MFLNIWGVGMKKVVKLNSLLIIIIIILICTNLHAQKPIRVGTTAAEFLSIGYDPKGTSMGNAYVSMVNDLTAIYWNPAGLSFTEHNEAMFTYQPWLADINTFLIGAGISVSNIGVFALGVIGVNYGEMDVTTVTYQDGTGERFSAQDYAFTLSYGRKVAKEFGIGATVKYITSSIWHETATAFALDLGVIIETSYFSFRKDDSKGMRIGMSLSNYGTPMKYDGLDLLRTYDEVPNQAGNYQDSEVKYETDSWELPLIFRIGISLTPISLQNHEIILTADALHVNNNNESMNFGLQYMFYAPGMGRFFLRGGYRALFLEDSEYGPTFGIGLSKQIINNNSLSIDYAYRDVGILGYVQSFSVGFRF
jgi:hypothetical protein